MKRESVGTCDICGREMLQDIFINEHHLIPKSRHGKYGDKILLHTICHNKIHSIWTESELSGYFHTIERIMTHPDMQTFAKWVSKKPVDFYAKTKRTNGRGR